MNDAAVQSLSDQLLGEETVEEMAGAIGRGIDLGPREGAPARGEIEALVLLAAAGQRAPREIPGEAEDARTLLGADTLGPVEEALDERTQGGIGELGCGRRGEKVVRAEETDDLVHAREPQREETSEGAEGTPVGEPHPRSPLVGALLRGVHAGPHHLGVAPYLAEHLPARSGAGVDGGGHAAGQPPGELELGL